MQSALSLVAVLVLTAVAPAAQTCRDAQVPIRSDCRFEPIQSSAAVAYLASLAATGALMGGGYLLYAYGPGDPTRSSFTSEEVGLLVMSLGAFAGPAVGNLTLGAGDAVALGMRPKLAGAVVGSGIGTAGLMLGLGCIALTPGGGERCSAPFTLLVVGVAISGAGLAVGTVVDLVTIPASARRLRRERDAARPAVTAALTPGGVALRVAL